MLGMPSEISIMYKCVGSVVVFLVWQQKIKHNKYKLANIRVACVKTFSEVYE